jgi:ABC-type transport system involved in multi-copper enzyme maturation permease subunit
VSTQWREWSRQAWTLALVEAGRRFRGRAAMVVVLLAGAALLIASGRLLFLPQRMRADVSFTTGEFAESFHYFLILFVVFFGCAALFSNLFRGEVLHRSLHHTLLSPLRREVVVAGKYLGGLLVSVPAFGGTALAMMVLFYLVHGPGRAFGYLLSGPGLGAAASYVLVAALACVGYGALFLLFGLLFRNPMVPAVLVLGWEYLVPLLPPALKVFSVMHHLTSLVPVPVPHGPFAILADPTPTWLAVPLVLVVSAALLVVSAWRARKLEVSYATE